MSVIYNKNFFISFNALSNKMLDALNNEQYEQFKILSNEIDTLITNDKYSDHIRKWSNVHQKLGSCVNDCLNDNFFQNKYSNIHYNYHLNDGMDLTFFNLLFIVHFCASQNNYIKLIEIANKITDINFNLNRKDETISFETLKCNFYLHHLKSIFQEPQTVNN